MLLPVSYLYFLLCIWLSHYYNSVQLISTHPSTVFEFDVMSSKPVRGFYKLTIKATGSDKRLVGNDGALLRFKVIYLIFIRKLKTQTAAASILKIHFLRFIKNHFLFIHFLRMLAAAVCVFKFLINLRLKQINLPI